MKRILALVLAMLLLVSATAFAEDMDLTTFTDDELNGLEQAIATEREARANAAAEAAAQAEAAPEEPPFEPIRRGYYNDNTSDLQQKLKDLGYLTGKVDGIFGPQTEAALMALQADMGLEQTGAVNTEEELNRLLNVSVGDGVNLLAESDYYIEKDNTSDLVESKEIKGKEDVDLQSLIGQTLTLSVLVNAPGERGTSVTVQDDFMADRFGCHGIISWGDSTGVLEDKSTYPATDLLSQSAESSRISSTFVVTPPEGYDTIKFIGVAMQSGARPAESNSSTWFLGYPKLELGSIATEWTNEN